MPTIINRIGSSAVFHTNANTTVVVAGNSSVSNIATPNEVLTGASITQVWYGCASGGHWVVQRGSNTVLVLSESGYMDFAGSGASLVLHSTANVVMTLVGASNGYCMVELQKEPTSTGYTS
jgi:hypothetical protein